MNRYEFLYELKAKLSQLPENEIESHLAYYEEMIDDRIEDGMTEEEAVASLEDVSVIAERILQDTSIVTLVKTTVKPKNGWTTAAIVAAIIGSPIWLSILISVAAVIFSVIVTFWAVVISIAVTMLALVLAGFVLLIAPVFMISAGLPVAMMCFAAGLGVIGIALFGFVGVKYLAKGTASLCKATFRGIKSVFIRKEN